MIDKKNTHAGQIYTLGLAAIIIIYIRSIVIIIEFMSQ